MQPTIILASSSPFRRQVLQRLGLRFSCQSPDIDESALAHELPKQLVQRLAIAKAKTIADGHRNALGITLVIGADQVAAQAGRILGKPANHDDAVAQLRAASGGMARLYSGIAVINTATGDVQSAVAEVEVAYRQLSDAQIERYLAADQPYNCCGSLKVESLGITLLKHIRSDDPNAIIGMPVILLAEILRNQGIVLP